MKYDILEPFKKYMLEHLPKNTALTYYKAVVELFRDIQFNRLDQISPEWIIQEMDIKFRTSNRFSAAKNGLVWLKKFDTALKLPTEEMFREKSIRKRNRSKRPKKTIYLMPVNRKINQIQDDRLRYAYRLAEVSGLRVSELADLEPKNFTFDGDKIFVEVKGGKGGHGGIIECNEDKYLSERLPEFLQQYGPTDKIFYSESYMRECAGKLGMECHDLRRIYAIRTRNKLKKVMPVEQANAEVQMRLRHVRFSTTKRYLFNRKLKFEYEREKDENIDCSRTGGTNSVDFDKA